MKRVLPAAALAACLIAGGKAPSAFAGGSAMSLSCLEALAAIEHPYLAGVFTFIPEKDIGSAFADLLARSRPAMRRYLSKLERDGKKAKGLTSWDHDVVVQVLGLYSSSFAGVSDEGYKKRLSKLSLLPTMPLAEMLRKRGT